MKSSLTDLQLDVYNLKALSNQQNYLHLILSTHKKEIKNSLVQLAKSRAMLAIWIHHTVSPLRNTRLFFFANKDYGSD